MILPMRLIGIRFNDQIWVASTQQPETPTTGPASLIAPLRAFWADPEEAISTPDGSVVDLEDATNVEVVPPVLPESRIICIGLNYADHVAEGSYAGMKHPAHPTLFARWTRSLTVGGMNVPVPSGERGLDWEGEIAAWVGRDLANVGPDEARAAIFGWSTFNDITARIAQKQTSQWILGKNAERSGPIGPLVTADEVGDIRAGLRLQTRVNGTVVQDSSSDRQIYEAGTTLSHISSVFTLRAGDILCTGTPSGVGYAREPEWLLHDGDTVEVEVERLGTLRTPIGGER